MNKRCGNSSNRGGLEVFRERGKVLILFLVVVVSL